MRTILTAVVGALVMCTVRPASLEAQRRGGDAQAVEAYFRAVGGAFSVSLDEVRILGEWQLQPEEIVVVLFVARRAGVSPDVVATLRGGGSSWATIVQRYGVGAGAFHVAFPEDALLGPLAGTYEDFAGTSRAAWAHLALSDRAIVALVNIRVLSNQVGVPVTRVLAAWGGARDFVLVHRRLMER